MLIKYTYPIKGDLRLAEEWPIEWGHYKLEWKRKSGKISALTISVRTTDLSSLPRITQNPQTGVAMNIHVGEQPYDREVEQIVRTAGGLLGFFSNVEIDFDSPTVDWEPETDDERNMLQLLSFSSHTKIGTDGPLPPLSYDIVARSFLAASDAGEYEILLSFLGKGRRDMREGRYIDAIYSFFFFLETQFSPGYSNPREVKKRFKNAPILMTHIPEARAGTLARATNSRAKSLQNKDDNALVEYLVDLRGKLHHHALPRKSETWHPEKHEEFKAEANFLHTLTHLIAHKQTFPVMFSEAVTKALFDAAKPQNAIQIYAVRGTAKDKMNSVELPTLKISVSSQAITHAGTKAIDEHIRRLPLYNSAEVMEYKIGSEDGTEIYAAYKCFLN